MRKYISIPHPIPGLYQGMPDLRPQLVNVDIYRHRNPSALDIPQNKQIEHMRDSMGKFLTAKKNKIYVGFQF